MKWREFISIFYGDLTEKSVTRAAAGRGVFFTVCAFTKAMETREALSILSFFYLPKGFLKHRELLTVLWIFGCFFESY